MQVAAGEDAADECLIAACNFLKGIEVHRAEWHSCEVREEQKEVRAGVGTCVDVLEECDGARCEVVDDGGIRHSNGLKVFG